MNLLKRITVAGFALLAMLFGVTGCDNGTKQCDCPNKIHGNAPCACGDIGCVCKPQFYELGHGITLKNESGIKDIDDKIALIEGTLTWMETNDTSVLAIVDARNVEMVLVAGSTFIPERERVTIGYDLITESNATNYVSGILFDMSGIAMNKPNSNTYLVNGRDLNTNAGWVTYRRIIDEDVLIL
jgi:hypothetical protein